MYVMSPFPFLHKYTHFQDITPRFFSFFRISIHFVAYIFPNFQSSGGQARGPEARARARLPPMLSVFRRPGAGLSQGFQAAFRRPGPRARLSGVRGPGARMRFCFYNIYSSCCERCKPKIALLRRFFRFHIQIYLPAKKTVIFGLFPLL